MISLTCKGVEKRIGETLILKNINLRLQGGNTYGLSGINGSGKTMLMRCMCGLVRPSSGYVQINGKILGKELDFPENVGALIENPSFLPGLTGFDNLRTIAEIRGLIRKQDIEEVLKKVGLDPKDKRTYRKYSLGMRQRLGIACACMERPDILILDEPLNALDEKGIIQVKAILEEEKKRGALIILSCHETNELKELADEIFVMENGEIIRNEVGHP